VPEDANRDFINGLLKPSKLLEETFGERGRAMNTLRQMAAFVGMGPGGDMRGMPNFVSVLTGIERTSMRAMIQALQSLPPISLEAEAENATGEVPLLTTVTVHPSAGAVQSTTAIVTQDGQVVGGPTALLNVLETSNFDAVNPGQYIFNISRVGVQSTGITTLNKNITINALPHRVPPPPPIPPTISVASSGSDQSSVFMVSGSGFTPNHDVRIRVVDDGFNELDFHQSTDSSGKLNARLGIPCNAGGTLHFSATDGRSDPSNDTGFLWSNTFNIPCP